MRPGNTYQLVAVFAAPPAEVDRVTLRAGSSGEIEDVHDRAAGQRTQASAHERHLRELVRQARKVLPVLVGGAEPHGMTAVGPS